MEIIQNKSLKTLSMVKLGTTYYALEDVQAVHKNELKQALAEISSTAPMTKTQLQAYCSPVFYETLSGAVADINADALGSSAAEDDAAASVAVYTDEDGTLVAVLLSDVTEGTVVIGKPLTLRLNGFTLTVNPGERLTLDTGADCVIDGRVSGSTVKKEVTEAGTVNEFLVETKCENAVFLGGAYELTMAESNMAAMALLIRNRVCRMEDCTVLVENRSGSGRTYCIQHNGNLQLSGCSLVSKSDTGICWGIQAKSTSLSTSIQDCRFASTAQASNACCVNFLGGTAELAGSTLSARVEAAGYTGANPFTAWAVNHRNSTQPEGDSSLTVTDCSLSAYARGNKAVAITQNIGTANSICNSRLYAASETGYAVTLENSAGATSILKNSECFADAASCDGSAVYSRGVENYGILKVESCSVYGTHSGMRVFPDSVTWVSGGSFEGVGHGGIYLSHTGGQAYIQDAVIANARYRGSFKSTFAYGSTQYYAAGLYFGGAEVSNTAAYLDNCQILGGTGNAIVMRGTDGEQNNALYLSNCDVTGSAIRIDSDTHKIYVGKACDVQLDASIAGSIVETGEVYWVVPPQAENTVDSEGAA